MKLSLLALVSTLVLGGCATQSRTPEFPYGRTATNHVSPRPAEPAVVQAAPQLEVSVPDPLNPECARAASFARAVSVLRDAGVNSEDVGLVIQAPIDVGQAIIVRDVYTNNHLPPATVHEESYKTCRNMSYTSFIAALAAAEAQRLQALVAQQKAEIALIRRTYVDRPVQQPQVVTPETVVDKRNNRRRVGNP